MEEEHHGEMYCDQHGWFTKKCNQCQEELFFLDMKEEEEARWGKTCKRCNQFEFNCHCNKSKSGFFIIEESPDDLTLYQNGKPILTISLPEMATQWNTSLP